MEPYKTETINFANMKAVDPSWYQIFLRGIGGKHFSKWVILKSGCRRPFIWNSSPMTFLTANWLVCFAVFISISSREIVSKITAIWWPTATFVAMGLDHW